MKRRFLKLGVLSLALAMGVTSFVGCEDDKAKNENTTKSSYSGTILSVGSTALQPLAEKAGIKFKEKNPDVTVQVQGGGSGVGINQVAEGNCQIGNSDIVASKVLKDSDKAKNLVETKVCGIGFALVANKDVDVDSITKDQIQKIYKGEVTNWNGVGGTKDLKINVINRGKTSGTRMTFIDTVMGGQSEKDGIGVTQDSTGNALKAAKETSGSITYVALANLMSDKDKEGIKILKIDGVEASNDNIIAKKYPFWSYEYMITKGEPKNEVKAFIDYIKGDDAKDIVKSLGYIPMSSLK